MNNSTRMTSFSGLTKSYVQVYQRQCRSHICTYMSIMILKIPSPPSSTTTTPSPLGVLALISTGLIYLNLVAGVVIMFIVFIPMQTDLYKRDRLRNGTTRPEAATFDIAVRCLGISHLSILGCVSFEWERLVMRKIWGLTAGSPDIICHLKSNLK